MTLGRAPLAVIAAGGTGGHMFPAQALAEALLARGWRVVLSTDARGAHYAGGFPPEVERRVVASATFARGGMAARAMVPFRVLGGVVASLGRMLVERPALVAGFGGYPSIPALAAAWVLRVPRMIHEQNAIPGKVNEVFARRVQAFAAGIALKSPLPGVRVVDTGNPVRAAVRARAASPYIAPGDYPMSLVVVGGSQGARALSMVVPKALALLPERTRALLRVTHQGRPEDLAQVIQDYAAAGIRAEVAPFFDDIPRRFSEAQLVISRAGASTLADLTVIGRPAILVPLPTAARDHQSANARTLAQGDAAVVIPESLLTPEALSAQVAALLSNPKGAARLAAAATAAGKPDAAEALADLAESLVRPAS